MLKTKWEWVHKIFNYIDKLSPFIKTWIIIILIFASTPFYTKYLAKWVLDLNKQYTLSDKEEKEKYAQKIALDLKQELFEIKHLSSLISNVLLISYHNTTESISGFSHLYLSSICEATDGKRLANEWQWLSRFDYVDEIKYVTREGYFYSNDIEKVKEILPGFYRRLAISDVKSVLIFPIEGVRYSLGLVIITSYEVGPDDVNVDWMIKCTHHIAKITALLDYENVDKWSKNDSK